MSILHGLLILQKGKTGVKTIMKYYIFPIECTSVSRAVELWH